MPPPPAGAGGAGSAQRRSLELALEAEHPASRPPASVDLLVYYFKACLSGGSLLEQSSLARSGEKRDSDVSFQTF